MIDGDQTGDLIDIPVSVVVSMDHCSLSCVNFKHSVSLSRYVDDDHLYVGIVVDVGVVKNFNLAP